MRLSSIFLLSTFVVGTLSASPITYSFTGTGASGYLNGVAFSNQTVTFSLTTDTNSIPANCATTGCITPGVIGTSFSVSSFPSGTVTDAANVTLCSALSPCGFVGGPDVGYEIQTRLFAGVTSSALTGYGMMTSFGPVVSNMPGNAGGTIDTNEGLLWLTGQGFCGPFCVDVNITYTFTATAATAAPEPDTLGLLLFGVLAIAGKHRIGKNVLRLPLRVGTNGNH